MVYSKFSSVYIICYHANNKPISHLSAHLTISWGDLLTDYAVSSINNKSLPTGLSFPSLETLDRRLRTILEDVRLVYLLDREGGWDASANWEDMLSLGEQQRLGMVSSGTDNCGAVRELKLEVRNS